MPHISRTHQKERSERVVCLRGLAEMHLKCTNLERAEEWNSDFACHRCSWCCPVLAAGENSSSNNGEAHCLTEALALAAVPPQIEVTLDECTAKQGRRKRNRKAKRVRRKDKREQAWRVRAEREGKRRSTTIWTWNVQRARFAFPFKGRFTEILRTIRKSKAETIMVLEFKKKDPGIKWIKAGDFYGVLVHGKHSGVILKCAWASDWKEQGYQRRQGDRSTMVMVKNLRLVATYQPVWNGENEDFLVFREELDSMSWQVSRNEVLLIGGDFNSNVEKQTRWEEQRDGRPAGTRKDQHCRSKPASVVLGDQAELPELVLQTGLEGNLETSGDEEMVQVRWFRERAGRQN